MFNEDPTQQILEYFKPEHAPAQLQGLVKPFGDLASAISQHVPAGAERTVALRKLLEAKDAVLRASISNPTAAVGGLLGALQGAVNPPANPTPPRTIP